MLIHLQNNSQLEFPNAKDSELVQKWEDYLISEGKRQGKQANIELKWVINVANADPGRQASNIEDLINQDVDLIMARAEDSSAIGSSIRSSQNAGIPFITFDRASMEGNLQLLWR